jgi:DNA repair photolyase
MTIIYEPRGKAGEYSPLAANLYQGCSHACVYCFAPKATFTDRQLFSDPSYIRPRNIVLEQLDKDAKRLSGDARPILLSFTSDAYQACEKELKITRQALKIMAANNLVPQILTKAGAWAINRDADILASCGGIWAATLTTDDPAVSLEWEPGAALPADRIEALRLAKEAGLQTWVSFEPVIDPDAVYRLIEATKNFVDLYKVGKLNYHKHAATINWPEFREKTISILQSIAKDYYIKDDLRAAT